MFVLGERDKVPSRGDGGTATPGLGHDLYHPPRHHRPPRRVCVFITRYIRGAFSSQSLCRSACSPALSADLSGFVQWNEQCAGALVTRTLPA